MYFHLTRGHVTPGNSKQWLSVVIFKWNTDFYQICSHCFLTSVSLQVSLMKFCLAEFENADHKNPFNRLSLSSDTCWSSFGISVQTWGGKKWFFISVDDAVYDLGLPLPLLTLCLEWHFLVLLLQANEMKTNALNHLQSEKEKKNWLYSKKGKNLIRGSILTQILD